MKAAGIGVAFFAVAALFGFFALATLVAAAVLGIAVALPAWLSALIVAAALAHRRRHPGLPGGFQAEGWLAADARRDDRQRQERRACHHRNSEARRIVNVPSEDPDNRVAALRAELEDTLDAIEDKLNVPKQVGRLKAKARAPMKTDPSPGSSARRPS